MYTQRTVFHHYTASVAYSTIIPTINPLKPMEIKYYEIPVSYSYEYCDHYFLYHTKMADLTMAITTM